MNLLLLVAILRRFRVLVLTGIVLATALAVLSAAHLSFGSDGVNLEYRGTEEWRSGSKLFVTQTGFPWGRSILDEVVPLGPRGKGGYAPRYADGGRFQGLAGLYAQLAQSDDVRALMRRDGPIDGDYTAEQVRSSDGVTLPMFEIIGIGATPEQAIALSERATAAFLVYFRRMQDRNNIAPDTRVQIEVVGRPSEAVLVAGRRLTRPVFVFVLVLTATVLLAFALENIRPRRLTSDALGRAPAAPAPLPEPSRRTA